MNPALLIKHLVQEWFHQPHHYVLRYPLPIGMAGVFSKMWDDIENVLGLQVAGHPKLDPTLVRFGCHVLQETAASLCREKLFINGNMLTRVVACDAVSDKLSPHITNCSKGVFLPIIKAWYTCMISWKRFGDIVPMIRGFPIFPMFGMNDILPMTSLFAHLLFC